MSRQWMSGLVVALVVFAQGVAHADMSRPVIAAFKGQLVVSKGELPEGKNDKDTIAKIKGERLKEVTGQKNEDVTSWYFHYTAFLNRPGAAKLKMEFYVDGKKYVADKRLDGIDPKLTVLTGDISISEDEGLTSGKGYVIKLVNEKDQVVATTPLLMK
ncbi:MAG: hypothetical protein AB7O24_29330 [Kofleriaceae bacterium]